jgi:phosphopantothenate--cysteine ligase
LKILITAGGTSERIDQVRSITNHSTGRLGKAIAEAFSSQDCQIDYVTTRSALLPEAHEGLTLHFIETTQELFNQLQELLTKHSYDAVIHSMAVSDFTPVMNVSEEDFLEKWQGRPIEQESFNNWLAEPSDKETETKISSNTQHLMLIMKQNPKIISYLRQWQPNTLLFGFKLLVDVPKEELLAVAQKSLEKNKLDFVLANDLSQIKDSLHRGYLLDKNGNVEEAETKAKIAELIYQKVKDRKENVR